MFEYKFYLPSKEASQEEHIIENNSVIFIGANGSGKTMLGAWIENRSMENVHRIGAQRSLNFKKYIDIKTPEQAEMNLFYGSENKREGKKRRWGYSIAILLPIVCKSKIREYNGLSGKGKFL